DGFETSALEKALETALRVNRVSCSVFFAEESKPMEEERVVVASVDPSSVSIDVERVAAELKKRIPPANGFMNGATVETDGAVCRFFVSKSGAAILKPFGAEKELAAILKEMYRLDVTVSLEANEADKEVNIAEMQRKVDESKEQQDKPVLEKKLERSFEDLPICVKYSQMLYGERLPGKRPTPISELSQDSGSVLVWGDVFSLEVRSTRDNRNRIITFNISDESGSYSAKIFGPNENTEYLVQKLKDGMTILLRGIVLYDKYAHENVLDVKAIASIDKLSKTDDAPEKRVELHLHTRMSAMDGMTDVQDLVKRAIKWGHKAIAITDHGVVQAFPDAVKAAKGSNIKLLFGMEGYLVNDVDGDDAETDYKKLPSYHIILLAKNNVGLKNLYKLITKSNLDYFYKRPRIPKSELMALREGIIVGSACEAGEVFRTMMKSDDETLMKIASFYDYIEIQPVDNNRFMLESAEYPQIQSRTDLENLNKKLVHLADKLHKPVVATCDVHFMDPEDAKFRAILMAGQGFKDADNQAPLFFRNTEEMLAEFQYLGEETAKEVVITNPNRIADSIDRLIPIPNGNYPPSIPGSEEELTRLCWDKAKDMFGDPVPEYVAERLEKELNSIIQNGFAVLYMIAQKLVKNSMDHGYYVGSRGSVGSSFVASMAGISEVMPLAPFYLCKKCKHSEFFLNGEVGSGFDLPPKDCPHCGIPMIRDGHDIPFETFLGFKGDKSPDIDLNFSGEYQFWAHRYTEELFGLSHVFKAGTVSTVADKTAFGYVKKYFEGKGESVHNAEIDRLCKGCTGIKRTTGQHPGGLVVVPQDMDVTDFCPVQHPADDPTSGIITTHFEYHCMEANLLKLDELGHDDPTMIRMMEDMTGVDAKKISLSDQPTMSIFTSPEALNLPDDDPIIGHTGTIGVPEFGTAFTRQMLVDTKPGQFDTLIRLSGFSHGTDVWAGNIRDLVTSGTATVNEAVGCRDDIMIYLIQKGMEPSLAFKTMEAVRKGKVKKSGSFPGDAEEQMRGMDVPDWWIESCRKIAYLFPKAHAVAYVMMAFRIAWFKVHEPLAFYSAYFYRRSQKGEFDAELMTGGTDFVRRKINEFKRRSNLSNNEEDLLVTMEAVYEFNMRGFEFAPIDLYRSDSIKFLITDDGKLLPPFVSISGLGESAAVDLVNCRKSGEQFISIEEVSHACPKVSQTHLQILKRLGALGDLPETSQINLFDF
ncbi:MAG TPA: PolC-type DNA polymerase III, partial [Ruminococcaceae bacterium]|nr:PolC-type DNA polymerase III [Oscillospiraceae bacterium]